MNINAADIAAAYIADWERTWNQEGAAAVTRLYTPDSVLVGYVTAVGRAEIERLLGSIYDQGWTQIAIKVVHARAVAGVVLVANEYSASGSGAKAGQTLSSKSSHVLVEVDGAWRSTLHTAP